ncbi:MAG: GGDEF domain-containing protein [Alphaproteobacteria bacterium]|nr:GGDEF domain-containing protein [Alphaproteobacteria bacterium]
MTFNTYLPTDMGSKGSFMEQVVQLRENLNILPSSMGHRASEQTTTSRPTKAPQGMHKILSTAMALLSQAQRELDQNSRQIALLKQQIADLEEASTSDMLTSLKNRRGFELAFNAELDRVRREKSVGGVLLMIDMNNFKNINDTYGHQAGDACLKLVGQALKQEIRAMDTAARLGGDEFVILMTDTTPQLLLNRIQTMIWRLNNLSLIWDNEELQISASVGMKPYDKSHSAAEIFSAADEDMYKKKQLSKLQNNNKQENIAAQ